MGFQKVNNVWTRKTEQHEKISNIEVPKNATEEAPTVSSSEAPQAPLSDVPSSSSSIAIIEAKLMNIVNSISKDLKEYVYESQRKIIKEIQFFKEETSSLTKSLHLNIDEQYVKLQKIQDDVNIIASTQTSNIITSRSDLLALKCSIDDIIQGQARDRARIKTLAVSLENLLTKQKILYSQKVKAYLYL